MFGSIYKLFGVPVILLGITHRTVEEGKGESLYSLVQMKEGIKNRWHLNLGYWRLGCDYRCGFTIIYFPKTAKKNFAPKAGP
jgi:hypothetical protein